MREIRLYGSEGGGAARSPYPYQHGRVKHTLRVEWCSTNEAFAWLRHIDTAQVPQPKSREKDREKRATSRFPLSRE